MNAEAIRREWAGRVIDGRFTLLEWLGGTERSAVFVTELPGPPAQKAAIKLMRADAGEAEARMAVWSASAGLSHPHLMRVLATGRCEMDGEPLLYVVSEYADEVLSQILPERALATDEVREMLGPVIDTLVWLHGHGFVHGHLKPSNILVVNDQLKLSADSLCRAGAAGKRSVTDSIYNAPETAAGAVTPAADVWSVGVTLVEALTQRLPVWSGTSDKEPAAPAILPQPFAGIARSCLQADPASRCTLGDVKAWLNPAAAVEEERERMPERNERGRFPISALVVTVIVVVSAAVWLYVRSHESQTPLQPEPASTEVQQEAPAPPQAEVQTPAPPAAAPTGQEQTAAEAPAQAASAPAPARAAEASGAVSERVMPDILPAARASIQGKVDVKIRVTVDAAGKVSDAALESQGPSRYFSKAALEAARQWKFKPARAGGQPVASAWILEFEFTRAGTEVTPVAAR